MAVRRRSYVGPLQGEDTKMATLGRSARNQTVGKVLFLSLLSLLLLLAFSILRDFRLVERRHETPQHKEMLLNDATLSLKVKKDKTFLMNESIDSQLRRLDSLSNSKNTLNGVNVLVEETIQSAEGGDLFISRLVDNSNLDSTCKVGLHTLIYDQSATRRKREASFMSMCGWEGMTDVDWYHVLAADHFTAGKIYKEGDTAGTAGITLNMNYGNQSHRVWFKVAPNGLYGERHFAQIAVFLLDRLLGLYYVVPTRGAYIEVGDLEKFTATSHSVNRFLQRVRPERLYYIEGSLSAWIREKLQKARLNLPPRYNDFQVLPRQQKENVEYALLLWLSGLSMTRHNIEQINGHPIAVDTDRAFRTVAVGYWSHANLCQFPRHVVAILRFAKTHKRCRLSELLLQAIKQDPLHPSRHDFGTNVGFSKDSLEMMDGFMEQLLDVVDECIIKYGEHKVLYGD